MACFADINVSQGSVATYARCGGIFNMHLTANLPRNLSVKKFCKSVKIWQNYGHESVAPFFGPPCMLFVVANWISSCSATELDVIFSHKYRVYECMMAAGRRGSVLWRSTAWTLWKAVHREQWSTSQSTDLYSSVTQCSGSSQAISY